MFGKYKEPPLEHPAVPVIEQILSTAMARSAGPLAHLEDEPARVNRAVWLCACVDHEDAPTWLIYDTDDDRIGWRRIPASREVSEIVDAHVMTGGHIDPQELYDWIQGQTPVNIETADEDNSQDNEAAQRIINRIRELYFG